LRRWSNGGAIEEEAGHELKRIIAFIEALISKNPHMRASFV
jgi:hypothetical protein